MKKRFSKILVVLLLFQFISIPSISHADSFYEGSGIDRSKCVYRTTYSTSELRKMGQAHKDNQNSIAALGIVTALTPVIGKYLSAGASAIALHENVYGEGLIKKANSGYKAKEYYCTKVNWDGYSSRTYLKYKFVKW